MEDIKLPIFLLVCVLAGAGYYFYSNAQNQAPVRVKPTKKVVETISTEEVQADKAKEKSQLVKATISIYKKGDYQKTLSNLEPYKDEKDYNIQIMIAYSHNALKEFDEAIVAFEKAIAIKKTSADCYTLAHLYEITENTKAAKDLYLELANQNLGDTLKKPVLEGIARISDSFLSDSTLYKYTKELVELDQESYDGVLNIIRLMKAQKVFSDVDYISEIANKHFDNNYQINYELGALQAEAEKYEESISTYKKCLKIQPDNFVPYFDCYKVFKKAGNIESAVGSLERFSDGGQVLPKLFFEEALEAHRINKVRAAIKLYASAVTSDLSLQGKQDNNLVSDCEDVYREKGSEIDKVFINAFISYINGDYETAINEINTNREELDNSPYKVQYNLVLAECEKLSVIDQKRDAEILAYENEIKAKEAAERLKKKTAEKNEAEGIADSQRLTDDEIKQKALKAPSDYNIQYQVAMEFINRGNLTEAKKYLKNATVLQPQKAELHLEMAKVLMMEGKNAESMTSLEKAIECEPRNITALNMAASNALSSGSIAKAKDYASKAMEVDSNDTATRIVFAKIYAKEGDKSSALSLVNKALEEEKSNIMRAELLRMKKEFSDN